MHLQLLGWPGKVHTLRCKPLIFMALHLLQAAILVLYTTLLHSHTGECYMVVTSHLYGAPPFASSYSRVIYKLPAGANTSLQRSIMSKLKTKGHENVTGLSVVILHHERWPAGDRVSQQDCNRITAKPSFLSVHTQWKCVYIIV